MDARELPLFFSFLVVQVLAVTFLVSALGGWRRLASAHPGGDPARFERSFEFQSLSLGLLGGYRGCVTVRLGPEGIWMRPILFFATFHPAVEIPWSAIERCEVRRQFFVEGTDVTLVDGGATIRFLGDSGAAIRREFAVRSPSRSAR